MVVPCSKDLSQHAMSLQWRATKRLLACMKHGFHVKSVDLSKEMVSEPEDTAVPGAVGSSISGQSWAAL